MRRNRGTTYHVLHKTYARHGASHEIPQSWSSGDESNSHTTGGKTTPFDSNLWVITMVTLTTKCYFNGNLKIRLAMNKLGSNLIIWGFFLNVKNIYVNVQKKLQYNFNFRM